MRTLFLLKYSFNFCRQMIQIVKKFDGFILSNDGSILLKMDVNTNGTGISFGSKQVLILLEPLLLALRSTAR